MAIKGMDVQGGRDASRRVGDGAQQIDEVTTSLTAQLNGFQWVGTDADRTRDQWDQMAKQLGQVTHSLREFSDLINKQAEEQEQVSA